MGVIPITQEGSYWSDGNVLKLDGASCIAQFTKNHTVVCLKMGESYGIYIIPQ